MKTVVITDLSYEEFDSRKEAIQVISREYYEARTVYCNDTNSISYTVHTVTPTTYVIPRYGTIKVGYTPTVEAALKAIFEVKERGISEQYKAKYEVEIARLRKTINKLLDKVMYDNKEALV